MLATALRLVPGPIGAYLSLEVRRSLRNRRYVIFTIAFPVILYVLYTAILPASSSGSIAGLSWPVYFLVSMASYGAIGASMSQANPIAAERASGWARQLRVTPLPSAAYVTTKLATAVLLTVPALVLLSLAGILVNHVGLGLGPVAAMVAALAVGSLPFAALGVLIGYVLDTDSAQGAMVLTYFGLAIFGGLFAPVQAFPEPLATIARVLPSYHFAQLGRTVVAGHLPDVTDVLVLALSALVIGGLAAWRYLATEQRARG